MLIFLWATNGKMYIKGMKKVFVLLACACGLAGCAGSKAVNENSNSNKKEIGLKGENQELVQELFNKMANNKPLSKEEKCSRIASAPFQDSYKERINVYEENCFCHETIECDENEYCYTYKCPEAGLVNIF
jgi:hypothetical protein